MRIWPPLVLILAPLMLVGCPAGTAYPDQNSPPDNVIVTVSSASGARVLPGASLALSAKGTSRGAPLSYNRFKWSASLVTSGQYLDTSGPTTCVPVFLNLLGSSPAPFTTDYSTFVTVDPTTEANIVFTPPTIVPAPAVGTLTTTFPYCVNVTAQARTGGATGSITIGLPAPGTTPTPPAVGVFGPVILTPAFLTFNFPNDFRDVTATQSGNSGNVFTTSSATVTCANSGRGSISQLSPGLFRVTALVTSAGQTCSIPIAGQGGLSANLQMTF